MEGRNPLKKTILVLLPAIFAQAAGNVFLSMRMKEMGNTDLLALLPRALESPYLWLGIGLLIISFVLFAAALSWADLTLVLPAISLEVVVNVVFAKCFLGELVSLTRWAGVAFIFFGVILVVRSERKKGPRPQNALGGDGRI